MKEIQIPPQAKRPIAQKVIQEVLAKYGVSVEKFYSSERYGEKHLSLAVTEICHRLYHQHHYSMSIVAQCINRDRTTVLHHIQKQPTTWKKKP